MKICYFTELNSRGGLETFIKNFFLTKSTNEHVLVFNKNNQNLKKIFDFKKNNTSFISYDIFSFDKYKNYFNKYLFSLIYSIIFPIFLFYQYKKLVDFFKSKDFDKLMIINGGYPGSDICLAAAFAFRKINPKKEIWINFHNLALTKFRNPLLNMCKNIVDYLIIKINCKFISVSNISSKSINKRYFLKEVKVKTIYNGLKKTITGNNVKLQLRKKYNLKKNDLIILLLAEYDDRKGYSYMFKTMDILLKKKKNIYLIAFGHGNLHFFKKKVRIMNLSKNVFLNCFSSSNIELIKQSDIISIPSQEYESFGYVAVEAMSEKKLVIATKCGGLKEIIKNNHNGYLANVEDPNDFAKKILFVINNKKEISITKKNAYNTFRKKFCYDKMNENYKKLIEK